MPTLTELLSLAQRTSVVNHLMNGNFLNVPKQMTAINNHGGTTGLSKVFRTNYAYEVTDGTGQSTARKLRVPGFYVSSTPTAEDFIGYWQVWGANAIVSFNDLGESFDGGHLVGVEFIDGGTVQFKQVIGNIDKFRGKTVSLALSGRMIKGDVKVRFSIDTGSAKVEGRPFFSRYFGPYYRMVVPLEVGLDITKFEVTIILEAAPKAVVGISGAMLAIGPYDAVLPYSDNPSDVAVPSGTIVLVTGSTCPSGYRAIADDTYLFAHFGDPNAFRGNMASVNNGVKMTTDPVIGENKHDHQSSGPNELQPAAFDVLPGRFLTPGVESYSTPSVQTRPVATYEADQNKDYFGPRDNLIEMSHEHIFNIADETVEPPRIVVRICEKI